MSNNQYSDDDISLASKAALYSLLNLTVLPIIGFVMLVMLYKKTKNDSISRYHATLGIKINIIAAVMLLLVSLVIILVSGLDSPWTWVYVISYFTIVHTTFIMTAIWSLVRSWSGNYLTK